MEPRNRFSLSSNKLLNTAHLDTAKCERFVMENLKRSWKVKDFKKFKRASTLMSHCWTVSEMEMLYVVVRAGR